MSFTVLRFHGLDATPVRVRGQSTLCACGLSAETAKNGASDLERGDGLCDRDVCLLRT